MRLRSRDICDGHRGNNPSRVRVGRERWPLSCRDYRAGGAGFVDRSREHHSPQHPENRARVRSSDPRTPRPMVQFRADLEKTMSNVRAPENRWLASYAAALARFQALTFFLFASVSFASDDFQPVPPSQQPAAWQRFEAAHRGISNFVANVVQTKTMTVFQQPVV